MFKNISIQQVILLLTASLTGVIVLILLVFMTLGYLFVSSGLVWLIFITCLLLVNYIISKIIIENFVFRRIILIYKMIHTSQRTVREMKEDKLIHKSILSVKNDVVKWVEEKQLQIDQLTENEVYRRSLLGDISHELKTPIFSIQGYLFTLLDGGINDESINMKYLRRATANLNRLEKIVRNLETVHDFEMHKIELRKTPFDLKELIDEVIEDHMIMSDKHNVKLALKVGASKSYTVLADKERIRQVLNNLIANAIKYGIKDGLTTIGSYDMAEYVLVEVSDDGIGIEEEHLKYLFDQFYRVDKSRDRESGGSGLGLAIVKQILDAHDETISVRSTVGEGSTFAFTLKKR